MSCAAQKEKRLAEIREFLGDLFDGVEGFVLIWTLPDRKSRFFRSSKIDEAAEWINAQAETKDIYVGIGTRDMNLGAERRGGTDDVAELSGLVLDLDIASPCHSRANLPATEKEATVFLSELPLEPTLVVHSGHGLQAWFLFERPIPIPTKAQKDRAQEMLKGLVDLANRQAEARGWKFDSVGELARVMRIPGTFNRKSDPIPVKVTRRSERRYNPTFLEETIREALRDKNVTAGLQQGSTMRDLVEGGSTMDAHFDDDIVLLMARKKYKEDFTSQFYKGDSSRFSGDDSRADLSLCRMFASSSDDPAQVDRLFRQSALMRPKWDERHTADGLTYGHMTVDKAIVSARASRELPRTAHTPTRMEEISVRQILGKGGTDILSCLKKPAPDMAIRTNMIAGLFPRGHVSILFGEPGSGKSLIAQRLACDLSAGLSPFGGYCLPEDPMKVLFLEADCASNLINERLRSSRWEYGKGLDFVYPLESLGWDFCIDQERGRDNILALAEQTKPDLVVMDTLSSLTGNADEISNSEMRPLFKFAMGIASRQNTAVLVIHHARKFKRDDSGKPLTLSDVSGAGMLGRLSGNVMAVETREHDDRKIFTLRTVKSWWPYPDEFSLEVAKGCWEDDTFPKLDMKLLEHNPGKTTKGGLVRDTVLNEFRDSEFTRREVELVLNGVASERTIRGALSEMVDRGELTQVNFGISTRYRLNQMGADSAGNGETALNA